MMKMNSYRANCKCSCQRCVLDGLFLPAIMIVFGILLLLSTLDLIDLSRSFPVILIVTGGLLLAKQQASTEGHVARNACIAPPPPLPISSSSSSGDASSNSTFYQGR